jgi:hypothetical protein
MKSYVHLWQCLAGIFIEQENFQTKDETHFLGSIIFFPKILEKYCRSTQATDDNIIRRMPFACWIPKATNTLRICNTYFFTMATVVTRTRLNVTLVHKLPVLLNLYSIWPAHHIFLDLTLNYSQIHKLWIFHCEILSPTFNCYCIDTVCFS